MLRLVVTVVAVLWFVAAAAMTVLDTAAWPMLAMAGVLLLGTLFERFHYRGADGPFDPAGWHPTTERFRDEETGRLVTIWFNPATGERRYVDAGDEA
ncbi:hypothetical protein FHR20_002198 [Sphingomonas leidyi]|jgi:hypothetical protein|uniref:Uncharacterized protein n=1 Tax=Sphingomonas leidyi TaxID=68569 RepID=A0A7X5V0N0_9SPHN|nr:hypothetical protein [Sphingomonas leidyi]NIJ65236.1 hypothetical protein [Sphingomonas leidyi]